MGNEIGANRLADQARRFIHESPAPESSPPVREVDPPPLHAFEVEIAVGGCEWRDVVREVRRLAVHLEEHGPECGLVSGGAGTASHIRIARRDVSAAAYADELAAWAERQRAKR